MQQDRRVRALLIAGRLLQSRWQPPGRARVRIERRPRETYPEAVRRVILTLPKKERDELRDLVAWVFELERDEAPAGRAVARRKRQAGI